MLRRTTMKAKEREMDHRQAGLHALAAAIDGCRQCDLARHRTRPVPGEGPADARIVLVGEAPGAREDRTGRPFIGPAGRFLDRLLAGQGLRRDEMFLTSCVKCRPPGNRTPHRVELETCTAAWLMPQLRLINPEVTVLCGRTAVRALLCRPLRLADHHGRFRRQGGRTFFITYHPAAAMRFARVADAMRTDIARLAGHIR